MKQYIVSLVHQGMWLGTMRSGGFVPLKGDIVWFEGKRYNVLAREITFEQLDAKPDHVQIHLEEFV